MFAQQSALTVKPGRPFVNHTLLGIGVFNCGVIVSDEVRLQVRKNRTKEKTVNMPGVYTLCQVETQAVSQLHTYCIQYSLYTNLCRGYVRPTNRLSCFILIGNKAIREKAIKLRL